MDAGHESAQQAELDVDAVAERIGRGQGHVHLLGVCGVGMAGLACLLRQRGLTVSGCDLSLNPLAEWLQARGVGVAAGHSPAHITSAIDWVIRSAAVAPDAEEVCAARARRIPIFRRGAVLPALLRGQCSIAIAGTHGKTTTSTFTAQMLHAAGRDPSFCIGGEIPPLGGVAGAGTSGLLVVEADESDGTLALYAPEIAVVTNIEFDHMEHFASVAAFEDCFRTFVSRARRVVYCGDDPRAARVCAERPGALSYGFGDGVALRAVEVEEGAAAGRYTALLNGRRLGRVELPVPGRHNVLNSLAALGVGLELGLPFAAIALALAQVSLPRRRFERVVDRPDIRVISDYGHHPSEVRALLQAARKQPCARLLGVFQPHRYTRTLALGAEFPGAFEGLDELVLVPVYAASEKPLAGGMIWDLYARFREQTSLNVVLGDSLPQAWAHLRRQLRPGDLLLVIGAGDVEKIAVLARDELAARGLETGDPVAALAAEMQALNLSATVLRVRENLGSKTTFQVGGVADVWAEIASEADLIALRRWTAARAVPFAMLGGGSNVLVSDLGVRGVVGRLTGESFRAIRAEGETVVAGAGASVGALLRWTRDRGLAGLEFLEAIPGTVGGAVRMNAGAWGHAIGERVLWARCVAPDGTVRQAGRESLGFAYRTCGGLGHDVVMEVALAMDRDLPELIDVRRREVAERREWMRGLHCAGSVFKNPAGDYAGRLIEAAGMKGRRIGGAAVSERHANVIVTERGARASDVHALIGLVRDAVERHGGGALELEVELLG